MVKEIDSCLILASNKKLTNRIRKFFKSSDLCGAKYVTLSDRSLLSQEISSLDRGIVFLDYSFFEDYSQLSDFVENLPEHKSIVIAVTDGELFRPESIRTLKDRGFDAVIAADFDNSQLDSLLKLILSGKEARKKEREFTCSDLINIDTPKIKHNFGCLNIFQHSHEGIWSIDVPEKKIVLSEYLLSELGYNDNSLSGSLESFFALIHPADKKRVRLAINDYLEKKKDSFFIQFRIKHRNGSFKWFLYRGIGFWDKNEKPLQLTGIQADINSLKTEVKRFETLALYDPLTKLPNRRLLDDRFSLAVDMSKRNQKVLGLLFVDLDRFKSINDTHGHKIGDLVLKETAKRLLKSVRKIDTVARLSGDEFVALLPNLRGVKDIDSVIRRINNMFSHSM